MAEEYQEKFPADRVVGDCDYMPSSDLTMNHKRTAWVKPVWADPAVGESWQPIHVEHGAVEEVHIAGVGLPLAPARVVGVQEGPTLTLVEDPERGVVAVDPDA